MAWTIGVFLMFASVALVVLLGLQTGDCGFISDEESLRTALFTNYSVKVRPDFKTNITALVMLASLNHLDIASQSMSVNMVMEVKWYDERLVWNSTSYGGIETLVSSPEDIWTPPVVIENAVENVGVIGGQGRDATPVRIMSDGAVAWRPPSEVSASCEMKIAQYPFDTQTCEIIMIGWAYPLSEMQITPLGVDTGVMYTPHGEFDLKRVHSYYSEVRPVNTSATEENTYRRLYFQMTYRRKWLFYGQNLLMPIVLNSILMSAVFALPIESGEKMGYCLTVLLSYVVFLTWVTENLPPVSTDTSILQVYLATVLCLGCFSTLLTNWILFLYHTSPEKPMSSFYRKFASNVLVPFYRLTTWKKNKTKVGHGDDLDPHGGENSLKTEPLRLVSSTSQNDKTEDRDRNDSVKTVRGLDVLGAFGSDDGKEVEETPTYTWQELSVLFDYFFLWLFGAILAVLTTAIFALLYADY